MIRPLLASLALLLPAAGQFPFFSPVTLRDSVRGTELTRVTDLNADGRPDLVYFLDLGLERKIQLQLNLGADRFGPVSVVDADFPSVGTMEVADLNGDGRPDLVAGSSSGSSGIRIYLHDGTTLAETQRFTGFSSGSLLFADIDRDGDPDLVHQSVVSATSTRTVKWRANDGRGRFGDERAVSTVFAREIAAADVDRDGDTDIVSLQSLTNTIAWYPNDGSGVFGAARTIDGNLSNQLDMDLADADGDGDVDLAVMAGSQIFLHRNNGSGSFSRTTLFSLPGSLDLVKFIRGDGDSLPDLAYDANSTLSYRRNLGGGIFASEQRFPLPGTGISVGDMLVTDYDKDGREDLVTTGFGDGIVRLHRNGTGSPPNIVSFGAADNTVDAGATATLNWSVESAAAVTLRIDGAVVAGSSLTVTPGNADRTYTLTATNAAGTSMAKAGIFIPDIVFADQATLIPHAPLNFPDIDAGDLNGDGRPDVAFVQISTDEVAWFPAQAGGTFGAKRVISTSLTDPTGVRLADVDKDGDLDLMTGHNSGANLYRNNGSGTFSAAVPLSADRTSGFEVADMNGDGWPDLVLLDRSFQTTRIALNDGAGNFPSTVATGSSRSYDVVVADVDTDGIQDLISLTETSVTLFRGTSPTTFLPGESLTSASRSEIAFGDVNGDGTGDLLVKGGTSASNTIGILPGRPGVGFGPRTNLNVPNISAFATGDFDGDLDLDIGFVTPQSSSPRNAGWIEGDGAGKFSELFTAAAGPVDSYQVIARDMDSDGDLDLLASGSGRILWLRNVTEHATPPVIDRFESVHPVVHRGESVELQWDVTGDPVVSISPGIGTVTGGRVTVTPAETTTYTISATNKNGTVTREITVTVVDRPVIHAFTANLNGIDRTTPVTLSWQVAGATALSISPDIGAVAGSSITRPVYETTTFTLTATNASGSDTLSLTVEVNPNLFRYRGPLPATANPGSGSSVATGDLNRDGRADIVSATGAGGTYGGSLFWMEANADGTFSASRTIATSTVRRVSDVIVADFDNDGWPDIAAAHLGDAPNTSSQLVIHRNAQGASWTENVVDPSGFFFSTLEAGDLDGDGRLDLIAVAGGTGGLYWYRNLGGGVFSARIQIAVNVAGTAEMKIADLDRDGDSDIVLGIPETGPGLVWFANAGDGTFGTRTTLIPLAQVRDFDLGDLDGDGDLDVALATRSDNRFYVYFNNGSQVFGNRVPIGTGGNTFLMFTDIQDVDSDGDLDIVHGELFTNWSENRGNGIFDERLMEFDPVTYRDVAAGDFNGDGDLDYAVVRTTGPPLGWLENLGKPPAEAPRILAFGTDVPAVLPGTRLDLKWIVAGFPQSIAVTPASALAPLDLRRRSMSITGGQTETEMVQTYQLTATNAAGTTTATFHLRVGNPPDLRSFTHTPLLVNLGDPVQLAWDIGRADSIVIAGAGDFTGRTGATLIPGQAPFTRYELTATNAFGSRKTTLDVEVNRPPRATDLPAFVATAAADPLVIETAPAFRDPDANDHFTWSITGNTFPELFRALAIDPATGRLTGEFAPHLDGECLLTIRGTDRNGLHAETTQHITLPRVPDPALDATGELVLNRQTGLFEQTLKVTNSGGREIGGFRIEIRGLPEGVSVRDAETPPPGQPWVVVFHEPVAAGGSVNVMIDYLSTRRGGNSFTPEIAVIQIAYPGKVEAPEGTEFRIDRVVQLADGSMLLEWPSVPGARYRVDYYAEAGKWLASPVVITASSDRQQWIDQGPPKTISHPSTVQTRLYRVIGLEDP